MFIYLSIYLLIFIHFFIQPSNLLFFCFVFLSRVFIFCLFVCFCICFFNYSFVCLFVLRPICSFIHLCFYCINCMCWLLCQGVGVQSVSRAVGDRRRRCPHSARRPSLSNDVTQYYCLVTSPVGSRCHTTRILYGHAGRLLGLRASATPRSHTYDCQQ